MAMRERAAREQAGGERVDLLKSPLHASLSRMRVVCIRQPSPIKEGIIKSQDGACQPHTWLAAMAARWASAAIFQGTPVRDVEWKTRPSGSRRKFSLSRTTR